MDFDKINIDAVSYNVKDTTARQQIRDETTARKQELSELKQNSILATDIGIIPNSNNDQAALIESAFTTHKSIIFPAGVYLLGRPITIPSGCGLIGCGVNITTFVFTSASGGITVTTSKAENFFNGCNISDISILARTFVNGAGVTINGEQSSVDRTTMFPHISNVHIGSEIYASSTTGFNIGISFQNCNCISVNGLSVAGACDYNGTWNSNSGIRITGNNSKAIGTENLLTNINVKGFNYGIYASFTEGVQVSNAVIVGNNYGIYWDDGSRAHPHLAVTNSHLANATTNVECHKILQGTLSNNLFYNRAEGPTAPMVVLDEGCSQWAITGNVFYNAYTTKKVPGISVAGDHMTIMANQFALLSADCVQVTSTASYITIAGISSSGTGLYVKNSASEPSQIKSDYNASRTLPTLTNLVSGLANSWYQVTANGVHVHFAFTAAGNIPANTQLYRVLTPTRLNPISSVAYLGILPSTNVHQLVTFKVDEDGYITNNREITSGYQFVVDLFLTYYKN